MATIAACPKCRGAVAVGEGDRSAIVGPLSDVRGSVPIASRAGNRSANFGSHRCNRKINRRPSTNASSETHAPDFPTLHEVPHLATHFASIPHAPESLAQRLSPKQKHLLVELVKIILGGIAGLLLGYAILFWGFRVDPFHFAKILPTGLVPSNLNPPAE